MTRFEIAIPYRTRDDSLADVGAAIREGIQDPEQREIARNVVLDAAAHGDRTAGDLLDRLEDPQARLAALNHARAELGLVSVERQRVRDETEALNATLLPGRDERGRALQVCAERDCKAYPIASTGGVEPVADRRWWCPRHKHLAGPDDHLPPEDFEPRFDPRTMSPIPRREVRERMEREERERKEKQRERNERQQREAEAIERARERYIENAPVMNVFGLRCRPDGKGGWIVVND